MVARGLINERGEFPFLSLSCNETVLRFYLPAEKKNYAIQTLSLFLQMYMCNERNWFFINSEKCIIFVLFIFLFTHKYLIRVLYSFNIHKNVYIYIYIYLLHNAILLSYS